MFNLIFAFERETPGAVRYQELDTKGKPVSIKEGAKIGTLYIRKTALSKKTPQKITVKIEEAR